MRQIRLGTATKFIWVLLGICALVSPCEAADDGNQLCKFLTPEGNLQERLEFRDAQEGFVGVAGEIWTVEPSGRFSIARFINEKTDAPYWERNLTPAELKHLAQVLATSNFLESPAFFGRDSKVNRHLLTLAFGKKKSTLVLNPGEPATEKVTPPPGDPLGPLWGKFISIVQAVQMLSKDRKPV